MSWSVHSMLKMSVLKTWDVYPKYSLTVFKMRKFRKIQVDYLKKSVEKGSEGQNCF